jgi:hypothetical protein
MNKLVLTNFRYGHGKLCVRSAILSIPGKKIYTRYTGGLAGRCCLKFHTRFLRCNHTGIGCNVPLNAAVNLED